MTSIDHFDLKASDFSCWIDDAGVVGTELFFGFSSFDYSSPDFDFGELRIGYSEYGNTDQITYVTLQPSEYLTGNDYLAVTPSLLGIDDYGTYIYITDLTLSFDYNRAASYLLLIQYLLLLLFILLILICIILLMVSRFLIILLFLCFLILSGLVQLLVASWICRLPPVLLLVVSL